MADRKLTDVELERSLAGDLPAARAAEATPADRARLAELEAEHATFLASVDIDAEVRRIQQRVERERVPQRRPWWSRWLAPAGALAVAAAVVTIVFVRRDRPGTATVDEPDVLTKGDDISLVIHVATDGGSRRLADGDTVAPGARIRFELAGTIDGYAIVVGVDGRGNLGRYYPRDGRDALRLGRDRLVPGAFELDATPGDERFFAVFARRPFALDAALPAIRGAGELPAGLTMSRVVLHKK